MSVSSEMSPPPAAAAGVFASRLPIAVRYAELLATAGVERGLIGPREAPRLWDRHLLNCAVVAPLLAEGATVADIGSGAGLPGLVLAIARADLSVTLVEPLLRRTSFLEEAVVSLGLTNVEVIRGRAEGLHGKRSFDVVTSRAVAALPKLLAWSLPLVRRGGEVVALKGSSAAEEVAELGDGLRRLGGRSAVVEVCGEGIVAPVTTVIRVVRE